MEGGRQRSWGRKMWVCVAEPQGIHSFNWTVKCLISVSIFYVCRKHRLECINTQVSLHANVIADIAPEMIHWWSCEVIWTEIQLDLAELQLSDEFWIQNMSTSVTPLTYFPSVSLTHWPCLQVDLNHVWCLSQTLGPPGVLFQAEPIHIPDMQWKLFRGNNTAHVCSLPRAH